MRQRAECFEKKKKEKCFCLQNGENGAGIFSKFIEKFDY